MLTIFIKRVKRHLSIISNFDVLLSYIPQDMFLTFLTCTNILKISETHRIDMVWFRCEN